MNHALITDQPAQATQKDSPEKLESLGAIDSAVEPSEEARRIAEEIATRLVESEAISGSK